MPDELLQVIREDQKTVREQVDRLAQETVTQSSTLTHIAEAVDRLVHSLEGNGTPGMKVRLDRLEQQASIKSKLLWVVFPIIVTAAVMWFVADYRAGRAAASRDQRDQESQIHSGR